ncbi:MAG: hypothetical protein QM658_00660 [Gordonia sp. (in: high G+C Gram-positive bacteria)]
MGDKSTNSMALDEDAGFDTDDIAAVARGAGPIPVTTLVLFAVGCVMLVLAAANLTSLPHWPLEHGQIPVFLAFFLFMSLAGRWFWTGIDFFIAAVRSRRG